MICYRDMTFCTYYEDCADAKKCPRPLTLAVEEAASKWWGLFKQEGGPPFCLFTDKPKCWKEK